MKASSYNKILRGEHLLENQNKGISNLKRVEGGYQLNIGSMHVNMEYSKTKVKNGILKWVIKEGREKSSGRKKIKIFFYGK